jgi:hypothetical protein
MWTKATAEDLRTPGKRVRVGGLAGTVRERRHARTTDGKEFSTWEVGCGAFTFRPDAFLATGLAEAFDND